MSEIMCGGLTSERTPEPHEKTKLEETLSKGLESHIGRKPATIEVTRIRTQLVNGTNYFTKVKVGNEEYIHARIHEALPCYGGEITIHSVQKDKKSSDALVHF